MAVCQSKQVGFAIADIAAASAEFAFGPLPDSCSAANQLRLFDHLVGAAAQRQGHVEAERLCGLEVDREFVLDWLLHWQVRGLLALKYTVNVAGGAPVLVAQIRTIRNQAAFGSKVTERVDRRQPMPCGIGNNCLPV